MKKSIAILSVLFVLLALSACQRVIDVQIPNAQQQIVIEANLNNQKGLQTVNITNSVPYSSANVYPTVSGAIVTITDALGNVYKLPETQPGVYTINNFFGKPQNYYALQVKVNGQTYNASGTMPAPVNLDSLSVIGQSFGSKLVKSVAVNFHDPAGVANQYRFLMYVNAVQVQRVFTESDRLTDGRNVTSVLYESDIVLKTGDVVNVEMQCIDGPMYNYWYALSSQGGNTPADSATPSNPTSNISNGALGYFSVHTTQRQTIIIP
ncbi:DUF4249 domain-containing protein [uncultured Mucilaginibacter sp.]|uniref:DUF4249 domain-containing protein n=1 Tax=uncultured Mucilaginibacter sp. TaxID=797541 RepID=UPI0025D2E9D5|nr:DUF4249 domain-containing protein [uncultured Mucilaginibacter sp.]